MGLVARALELAGFPTLNLTAAYSITQAVNPPRAAFVDMPLGYTAGRPHEPDFQRALLKKAFNAVELIQEPGTIFDTEIVWSEDESWKEKATSGMNNGISSAEGDSREERLADPQYQYETDRLAVKIRE